MAAIVAKITLRIHEDLHAKIKRIAEKSGRSINSAICILIMRAESIETAVKEEEIHRKSPKNFFDAE